MSTQKPVVTQMPSFDSFRSLLKISRSRKESMEFRIRRFTPCFRTIFDQNLLHLLYESKTILQTILQYKNKQDFLQILFLISERIRINNTNSTVLLIIKVIELLFSSFLANMIDACHSTSIYIIISVFTSLQGRKS